MKPIGMHNYYVYILTNKNKSVLYIGVTNNLDVRIHQHKDDSVGQKKTFTGRYNCIHLVYYERYQWVQHALAREKELKGWRRSRKEALISEFNPEWSFLENDV